MSLGLRRLAMNPIEINGLMRVFACGMGKLALVVPDLDVHTDRAAAERALLGSALAQGGWVCLPRLGYGLLSMPSDSAFRPLVTVPQVSLLLARWASLGLDLGWGHRVEVLSMQCGAAELQHGPVAGAGPVEPIVSLAMLGLLAAALEAAGWRDVAVRVNGVPVYPWADESSLAQVVAQGRAGRWRLTWQPRAGEAAAQGAADAATRPGLLAWAQG
jgi:hypothetical protein